MPNLSELQIDQIYNQAKINGFRLNYTDARGQRKPFHIRPFTVMQYEVSPTAALMHSAMRLPPYMQLGGKLKGQVTVHVEVRASYADSQIYAAYQMYEPDFWIVAYLLGYVNDSQIDPKWFDNRKWPTKAIFTLKKQREQNELQPDEYFLYNPRDIISIRKRGAFEVEHHWEKETNETIKN